MISFSRYVTEKIANSSFLTNILSIASANLISQFVLLVATPILTRLYSPENFGVAALFITSLKLVGSVSTWRFDRTVPNATSKVSALILCCWGFVIIAIVSVLAMVFIFYEKSYFNIWNESVVMGLWLYLLPIAILFSGTVQLGASWYARSTNLKPFSRSILMYTIVYLLVALLAGVFGMGGGGLIVAATMALVGQVIVLAYFFRFTSYKRMYSWVRIFATFKTHIGVATTATGVTFVNTLSLTAPIFLLSQVYAVSDLGVYALMSRLITTPLGVLTKSLSISFWSRAAELGRQKRILELHKLYVRVCFAMALPALLITVVCLVGSFLVVPVLGAYWHDAGPILLGIIPYVVGLSIASPTNHLWVLRRQSYQYFADGTRLVLMIVVTILSYHFKWSFGLAVFLLSTASLVGHLILVATHIVLHKSLMRERA